VARYGVDLTRLGHAIEAARWPESQPTWCGVAAAAAVIDYHMNAPIVAQQNVATLLASPVSVSAWGTPPANRELGAGPGFAADIARDVGTDPRALAYGQAQFTTASYHAVVDYGSAYDATLHLIADLLHSHEPIHALMLRGSHSVLVSGVLASDDPLTDPSGILDLEVWDPGYGMLNQNIQYARLEVVPLDQWLTSTAYWGAPYSENRQNGVPMDPDPSVGPYAYDPSHGQPAHLWVGHRVYIRPDGAGSGPSASPAVSVDSDWALDPSGAVIAGANGELPIGYGGPTVTLAHDAPIAAALTISGKPRSLGSKASTGVPWWLALGALPLLFGGIFVYATLRAHARVRQAAEASFRRKRR
jgi:hypothetical protein